MVEVSIFSLHGVAAIYAFITRRKEGGLAEGFLAVAFVAIIFSVGWTIMTMLTRLVFSQEGLATWFNRDAITLTLLTLGEAVFYFFFLRSDKENDSAGEGGESSST